MRRRTPFAGVPRGRVGDVVPQDATDEQLVEMYGDPAGYEIVAMRQMQAVLGQADRDEFGKLRVGPNLYAWASGEMSGKELCEAEGLAGFPARLAEESATDQGEAKA